MSETQQTEAGCWVELWDLILSKKRIVCGYLSMETWQVFCRNASVCSFLTGQRCAFQHLCLMTSDTCHCEHTSMSPEDFYMGGRETSMIPGQGQKRKCLSDTGVCVKFSNPVLITKLPNFFFNSFCME